MIDFNCPHCNHPYSLEDESQGRAMRCRNCEGFLTVPAPGQRAQPRDLSPEEQVSFLRYLLRTTEQRFQRHSERHKHTQTLARELYKKYKELQKDFDERERFLQARQARIDEAKAQLDRLTHELTTVAETRGEAVAQLEETLRRLSRIREQRDEALQARRVVVQELSEARVKLAAAEPLLERTQALEEELAAAREEVERLRGQLATVAEEPRVAIARQEGLERELARVSEDLTAEREVRQRSEEECRNALVEAGRLREALKRALEEKERLEAEVQALRERDDERKRLRDRVPELERQLSEARAERESALAYRSEAEVRIENLQRENSRLGAELQATRLAEAEGAERLRLAEQRAVHADLLAADRDQSREQLREAQAQIERLRVQLANSTGSGSDVSSEISRVVLELENLREELSREHRARLDAEKALLDASAATERAAAEAVAHAREAEQFRATAERVELLERELEAAQGRVSELERFAERLTAEVCTATRASGSAEARLEERNRALERLNEELRAEREAREQAEKSLREAELRARVAEERLEDALRRVEAAEAAYAKAGARGSGEGRSADGGAPPVFAREEDDEALLFIPEIVQDAIDDDGMMDTLLRFIEPE